MTIDSNDRTPIGVRSRTTVGTTLLIFVGAIVITVLCVTFGLEFRTIYQEIQQGTFEALTLLAEHHATDQERQFEDAENQITRLKAALLDRLDATSDEAAEAQFHALFQQEADGLWRVRPELNDPRNSPTLYLQPVDSMTPSLYRRATASYELLRERGPALVPPFYSVYMDFVEKGLMVYSPEIDWGRNATPETNNFDYPTMIGSMPENNPGRAPFWTPLYFDSEASTWMVSAIEPLDWKGDWVGTVGVDVSVGILMNTVLHQRFEGSYNIVLGEDGQLVVHPGFTEEILNSKGELSLQSLNDPLLNEISDRAVELDAFPAVVRTASGSHWMAITRIDGPGWYLVSVYPNELFVSRTFNAVRIPILAGIATLLLAMVLLGLAVSRIISQPLRKMEADIAGVAHDERPLAQRAAGQNEVERVSHAFELMTDRLQERDRELVESEHKYRQLVESANSIILRLDKDARILFINDFGSRFFEYSSEEMIGKSVLETILPPRESTGRDLKAFVEDVCTHPENHVSAENENIRKTGEIVWVLWTNRPVFDADGQLVEILCIGNDATERRRLEAQLHQSQKMEAVGQLAGGIAHDFNNLLQIIQGYTEVTLSTMDPDDERSADLRESLDAAKRAASLTRQLLAFSRRQVFAPKALDLNAVVSELVKMIERLIGMHIELTFIPEEGQVTISGDPSQMEQVIMNLCVNARDAMPEGGKLILETRSVHFESEYVTEGATVEPGNYVVLNVSDTGEGMKPETLHRIFEPFFSTKEMGKGTGLGLATVYGIVHQHEGHIEVYSEAGQGTTFKLYFPALGGLAPEIQTPGRELAPGGDETILFAEDDIQIQHLVRRILEGAGYTVLCTADGEEAVTCYKANVDHIDMLLLDVIMPNKGGHIALEEIRSIRPDIPCLFASGYSEQVLSATNLIQEGTELIEKPYQKELLLQKLREILDVDKGSIQR